MNDIIKSLPEMMYGDELVSALSVLPEYHENVRLENEAVRLVALSELYKIYLPSYMSMEIYNKIYLAVLHSLQKKMTKAAVVQRNENFKGVTNHKYNGIMGGSDSFTIIGTSGIGKSSAINRAIDLITVNGIIETREPYSKIAPCLVVQCPFDSSVKGLLLEILRKVDEAIGSDYYIKASKARITTDMLIGSVSQVAINHIGLLIVDEIQNVVNSKNGKSLVGMLTQLINNSGISICMVGTPESSAFFEQAMQLARRSLGLQYQTLEYDDYFCSVCKTLFSYQYVKTETVITDAIIRWLYEHSNGVISVVVSLIHDAQEIAIISGREVLGITTLNEAYKKRLSYLHAYLEQPIKRKSQKKECVLKSETKNIIKSKHSFAELITMAKESNTDIVEFLKRYITIEEISI